MIRTATPDDIGALLVLCEQMHAESPRFSRRRFSVDKMAALLVQLMSSADGLVLVADHDGEVTGCFGAYCVEDFFGPDRSTSDIGLFVRPDRRGGIDAVQMLAAYREWASSLGVTVPELGISTGLQLAKATQLYQSQGFQPVGTIFEYQEVEHVHGR